MNTWYEKAVFYHMYPLGMTGAPKQNFPPDAPENVTEAQPESGRFGDLCRWIPHIKDLGCSAIYIGPLFESASHGYDTRDFKRVDRRLGDNADFTSFVSLCHENDIRVVVDGVFNHTGREFFAFRDIQKNREASPYCGWYKGVNFAWSSPLGDPFGYESWHGIWELPCLNLPNPEVRSYLLDIVRFWVREFDIDGIRLDCANVLDFQFMKELRQAADSLKPDFWLMGEVIHGDYAVSYTHLRAHETPGIPSIYYGSEWGMEGRRTKSCDDMLRPAVEPSEFSSRECGLTSLIRTLSRIHSEEKAFHGGAYKELLLTNRQYAFARYKDGCFLITAANNDDHPAGISIPLPAKTAQTECTDLITGKKYPLENSHINIELEGNSAVIFRITEG